MPEQLYTRNSLSWTPVTDFSNISDGNHTFKELYQYRMLYNAALFNQWSKSGVYDTHKSIRHSDGEYCFGGGWFIVVAELPTGQVSNHYELDSDFNTWNLFNIEEKFQANEYDGHSPADAAMRLEKFLVMSL